MSDGKVAPLESSLLGKRAHAALLQAITEGRFQGKLPSEPELADMLNISRTTLRVALQTLEKDGIITRRRAVGTTINGHVTPSTLAIQRLIGFEQVLLEGQAGANVDVDGPRWTAGPTPDVFTLTHGLPPDGQFLCSEKKYLVDGRVALWARDVIPRELVKGAVDVASLPKSLLEFSEVNCDKPIDHALARLAAGVAGREGVWRTALVLPAGEAFVQLRETFYAADGTVVAYGILDFDNSIELQVFRRRE
jgi:GntR family transcriptional regulator